MEEASSCREGSALEGDDRWTSSLEPRSASSALFIEAVEREAKAILKERKQEDSGKQESKKIQESKKVGEF